MRPLRDMLRGLALTITFLLKIPVYTRKLDKYRINHHNMIA